MRHVIMILSTMVLGVGAPINDAYAKVALAQVRINVVDQDGIVVPDARIWGGFTCGGRIDDYVLVDGMTNTNGEFVAQGKCNEFLRVDVTKEGYYQSEVKVNFLRTKADPRVADGKWQPYGEVRTVVLKKIKKPTAMSLADKRGRRGYPGEGDWVGYDLAKHDWVSPEGNGVYADMKIRFVEQRFTGRDFARIMEVSFEDVPYGGAYLMDVDECSELKTSYTANTNALYMSRFKYEFKHKGRELVRDELNDGQYLVFRTRTETNPDGTLKSAHYGVIMGNWKFFERYGMSISKILFNPTPNDTNLEDAETARLSRLGYKQQLEFERRRKAGGK